jgi:5,10-methylenetetrahydrofolate reductase
MATVIDRYHAPSGRHVVLSDFTPPRSGDASALDAIRDLPADFISVAYNPGKLVRADSVTAAYLIKERCGKDVVFNLAPRDMNKIALQSRLLGAQMLGLENVVVLQGDPLTERELGVGVTQSEDYTTCGLIESIQAMNGGNDYRGAALRGATSLCVGATIDLSRGLEAEARLAARKSTAGAQFFITQPIYDVSDALAFLDTFQRVNGSELGAPVFWGLHIAVKDGVTFDTIPEHVQRDLERGRSGVDIAQELMRSFEEAGFRGVYLVPPILRGGARDYDAAKVLLTGSP